MAYLLAGCLALLLSVFAAAAWGKLRSRAAWSGFVASVRELRLVPARAARPVAAGIAAGEAAVVPLLAVPATVPAGLMLAGALLGGFTVAIAVTLRRGVPAVCRCFGRSDAPPLGGRHLVRNGLLLAAVALAGTGWSAEPTPPQPAGVLVAAVAGLVGAVVLVFFDELVDLFGGDAAVAAPAGQRERQREQGRA